MSATQNHSRLSVRLSPELKQTIEQAAAALGQTVSEFTVSTAVKEARQILQVAQVTRLSNRDRDAFFAALESDDSQPNDALRAAARKYGSRAD